VGSATYSVPYGESKAVLLPSIITFMWGENSLRGRSPRSKKIKVRLKNEKEKKRGRFSFGKIDVGEVFQLEGELGFSIPGTTIFQVLYEKGEKERKGGRDLSWERKGSSQVSRDVRRPGAKATWLPYTTCAT